MRLPSRLSLLRATLALAVLAPALAACTEQRSDPLAPRPDAPAARAAVTDAEVAAAHVRTHGPGARIW